MLIASIMNHNVIITMEEDFTCIFPFMQINLILLLLTFGAFRSRSCEEMCFVLLLLLFFRASTESRIHDDYKASIDGANFAVLLNLTFNRSSRAEQSKKKPKQWLRDSKTQSTFE